ncbi:SRPBCC family protein [Allostreptomyces psammosilenae]|uniref:Uncharacterized protein YndB with AHSA1/START domain n=1 Tax=Allostreptomyces psammosilenae TaxID=1892865 RepID=A0A853A3F3_9ACTN|nr:SRPBCC family protein [Allostreptomyces psammosilenae]NYI05042.1 uncharacterized protein YndB with AHSA1/START domain [Allostreptomyces psammosilenae]
MTATLRTVDGRSVLVLERRLPHPPERVWRALTDAAEIPRWFPADMDMELRVGARIDFVFREGEGPPTSGVITELDPPRVFAYSWDEESLRWELSPGEAGDGCLLTFTHTFDDRPAAASYAAGWDVCLDALEQDLAGARHVRLRAPEDWAERQEVYAVAFGLAEGTSEETPEGWRVRFERQLTWPLTSVWTALASSGFEGPGQGPASPAPRVGAPPPEGFTNGKIPTGAIAEVTEVEAPMLLEYVWRVGEGGVLSRVRWELSEGPGGARVVLTQTGPPELADERAAALAAWRTRLEMLAGQLRGALR